MATFLVRSIFYLWGFHLIKEKLKDPMKRVLNVRLQEKQRDLRFLQNSILLSHEFENKIKTGNKNVLHNCHYSLQIS